MWWLRPFDPGQTCQLVLPAYNISLIMSFWCGNATPLSNVEETMDVMIVSLIRGPGVVVTGLGDWLQFPFWRVEILMTQTGGILSLLVLFVRLCNPLLDRVVLVCLSSMSYLRSLFCGVLCCITWELVPCMGEQDLHMRGLVSCMGVLERGVGEGSRVEECWSISTMNDKIGLLAWGVQDHLSFTGMSHWRSVC